MRALLKHPLVHLQVANAAFFLRSINRLDFYLALIFGVVLQVFLLSFGHRARLKWQRSFCDGFRRKLVVITGLKRLLEIGKDDWDLFNGSLRYTYALVGLGAIMITTFIVEGRYFGAMNLGVSSAIFYYAARSQDSEIIMFTGRFNVVLQLGAAASFGSAFGPEAVRRMLIIRSFISLATMESIVDLFCHTVLFPSFYLGFRFGYDSNMLMLPWVHFFITVLPTEVMGLRLCLLRKIHNTKYISPGSYVAIVMLLVPVIVAMTSFSKGADTKASYTEHDLQEMSQATLTRDAAIPGRFLSVVPYIGLVLASSWPVWGQSLDALILRMTASTGMPPRTTRKTESTSQSTQSVLLAAYLSTLTVLGMYGEIPLFLLGLVLFVASRSFSGDVDFKRTVFLVHQTLVWLVVQHGGLNGMNLFLACSRLWLAFEPRTFSDILAEALFASSFQLMFASSLETRKGILGISGCGLIVALALRLASENLNRFLNEVKAADSFLDHAIKQRLAALGSVLQHALETSQGRFDEVSERMIAQAIFETQLGLAACHLSSAALRFESGTFSASLSRPSSVVRVLRSWGEDHDVLAMVAVKGEESVEACLDWDLLRSLVIDMMRHHLPDCLDALQRYHQSEEEDWPVQLVVSKAGPRTFTLRVESRLKGAGSGRKHELLRNIRENVVRALGGTLNEQGDCLQFPLVGTEQASVIHAISPTLSSGELSSGTPPVIRKLQDSDELSTTRLSSPLTLVRALSRTNQQQGSNEASIPSSPVLLQRAGLLGGDAHRFPRNLIIAALDDNGLVRMSLALNIRTTLHADLVRSFVTGARKEEALHFPQRIIEAHVQIALFDENLEYDDDGTTLKGSTLATRAKQMGFRGCLVLHSANAALAESLDPCFDGFLEKTSSKDQFLRNIARVYGQYLTRSMSAGHSLVRN